jgi:hypothetical protein
MSELTIEDEDGFTTTWPWPDDKLMMANGTFVAIFQQAHDQARREAGLGPVPLDEVKP